jgi:hypothetical protein
MKKLLLPLLLFCMTLLSSCAAIEGIFKAGMWIGILASAAVVGVIIWIIMKVSGRK